LNFKEQEPAMSTDQLHIPTSPSKPRQPARALWIAAAMTALVGAFFLLRGP
jgi:LPS O-antigen subunit length determinant protein (WzzB/FepE family)